MTTRPSAGIRLASILPITAEADPSGRLWVGGCDVSALVAEYGTPLYLYDETTIRSACREFQREFGARLPGVQVLYAAKAYLSPSLAAILAEEGLGMDVVSGGELFVARRGGFPPQRIAFHGNNKSEAELVEALEAGVGRVMIDNEYELQLLDRLARERGRRQPVLLRLTPGVDPHTQAKTATGVKDSKFGLAIEGGGAERATAAALAATGLELTGFHMHLGSPLYETEPYALGIERLAAFAAGVRDRLGFTWRELSPGGGFAVTYTADTPAPPLAAYAETIASALEAACRRHGLPPPEVQIEPGRAIVARAGLAVYTVGARKETPGGRTYVAVDGGMADNIRPALYGSAYTALVANRVDAPVEETVTIAGKFCESGDLLIEQAAVPRLEPGDLLAIPASGAYNLALESNYNRAQRPAVLFVRDGKARLTRRRESYDDLVALDALPEPAG